MLRELAFSPGRSWQKESLGHAGLGLLLLMASLLCRVAHAQERTSFSVAFHTVNGMILLDGQLNGRPAIFLLDTGSNVSFVDMHSASSIQFKANKVRRAGMSGCVAVHSRLNLGGKDFPDQKLCVADPSDVSKSVKERVDGFIGSDILQTLPPSGLITERGP